ncbi:ferredoxin [Patescibacteria group bacterium]|jgi:ferredoxin|nr:ferredoxin [Patescibacteria group bacterium]
MNNTPSPVADPSQKPLRLSKITVDRDLCIGAAPCVTVAPGVFQLDDENKAYVVDENGADAETILLAAQACPVQAIILHDADGNQIYP